MLGRSESALRQDFRLRRKPCTAQKRRWPGGRIFWAVNIQIDLALQCKIIRTLGQSVKGSDFLFPLEIKFLYKGIIIKHNKTEPTYTKTSLFLYEKRRFFMAGIEKGVVLITYLEKEGGKYF